MPRSKTNLTAKQARFVEEYLADLNATQAAIRAGYSASNADKIGSQLLGKTRVASAIRQAQEDRAARAKRSNDDLLDELDNMTVGGLNEALTALGLKPAVPIDEDVSRRVKSVKIRTVRKGKSKQPEQIIEITFYDKIRAIELSGRHRGMFNEKHEHTGKDGKPIEIIEVARPAEPKP